MRMFFKHSLLWLCTRYNAEEKGNAALETALVFPILITLLMGTFDIGNGIAVNQRTVGASQIIGDLIARNRNVDVNILQDIVRAGELAFDPYPTDSFGYDIISIQFDDDGDPVVLWRMTENMPPNDDALESTEGLGSVGEGLVIVTARYQYDTFFSKFIVPQIQMQEVAFLKGRKSATIVCDDCPS